MPTVRGARMHSHVAAIIAETGEDDPVAAVRAKAAVVVREFHALFGGEPPFNLTAMASCRGLFSSSEAPQHSKDSEIVPQQDGRVVMRINRDRPITRQRFSVGHEIGHTLFPDFQLKVQCRKALDRDWADPNDQIEMLCDIAASEFLFPGLWFMNRVQSMELSAEGIAGVALEYQASRDATVRRLIELRPEALAAVFFSWKLKPTELRQKLRDRQQKQMFGAELGPAPKLRVDYALVNASFADRHADHIPKDKSIPLEGPIYIASTKQVSADGDSELDLGTVQGRFAVHALPVFTHDAAAGPEGSCSVVAILCPR